MPSNSVARDLKVATAMRLDQRREESAAVVVHHTLGLLGRERLAGLVGELARCRHALGMRVVRAHDGPLVRADLIDGGLQVILRIRDDADVALEDIARALLEL